MAVANNLQAAALKASRPFYCRCQQDVSAVVIRRMLAQHPWLTGERAASLQPGCAGILAIMHHLQVHDVLVSDADLLAGIVQSLATKEDEHGTHYQG